MNPRSTLPHRPRLGNNAMLRRHVVDGNVVHVVHDVDRAELMELDERQFKVLLCCDGTRDLGGIALAAYRASAYRRGSDIERLLLELQQRGLIADGLAPEQPLPVSDDRPIEVLPGYRFHCDAEIGKGSCCTTYSSLAFTRDDRQRAEMLVPTPVAEGDAPPRERVFLPIAGSVDSGVYAAAMVDGSCSYLDGASCRIHATGGEEAKPVGCSLYPATFIDDTVAIRASVMVECACVLASAGQDRAGEQEGSALVPETVRVGADLPPAVHVARVPAVVRLHGEHTVDPQQLHRWSAQMTSVLQSGPPRDGVALSWSLAEMVRGGELADELPVVAAPSSAALAMHLLALNSTTKNKLESSRGWRSSRDRTRRLSDWFCKETERLQRASHVAELLEMDADPDETFYLQAVIFGHQLVDEHLTVAQGLRDRAVRLLLARALRWSVTAGEVPSELEGEPSLRYPITAVEAMMRGQGLASYAVGLP